MANIENFEAVIWDTLALTEMAQVATTNLENLATFTTTGINTFNELTGKKSDQSSQITTLTNKLLAANKVAAKIKTEILTIKRFNG